MTYRVTKQYKTRVTSMQLLYVRHMYLAIYNTIIIHPQLRPLGLGPRLALIITHPSSPPHSMRHKSEAIISYIL